MRIDGWTDETGEWRPLPPSQAELDKLAELIDSESYGEDHRLLTEWLARRRVSAAAERIANGLDP